MLLIPLLALTPPPEGTLLLVPLVPQRPAAIIAVERGALILAAGPTRGSLVVRGRLNALAWPMLSSGILTLGAPAVLCGVES